MIYLRLLCAQRVGIYSFLKDADEVGIHSEITPGSLEKDKQPMSLFKWMHA